MAKPRIVFLTNNLPVTENLFKFLSQEAEVFLYSQKPSLEEFRKLSPDWFISYNYRFIIGEEILKEFPNRFINLHISYLPWNRGAYPNLWSFIEETPKGVTIHLIDQGLDTGDILFQKEVFIEEEKHTLASSYNLLHKEIQTLFIQNWERIKTENLCPKPQQGKGTFHTVKEFKKYLKPIIDKHGWNIPIPLFKKLARERLKQMKGETKC
jgi:methionyl-tRNA formyltransferase